MFFFAGAEDVGKTRRSLERAKLQTFRQASTGSKVEKSLPQVSAFGRFVLFVGPVASPMLPWAILSFEYVKRWCPCLFRIIFRDCGEFVHVFQTPRQRRLDDTADVKYSHGIETQRLAVHPFAFVNPREPRNATA